MKKVKPLRISAMFRFGVGAGHPLPNKLGVSVYEEVSNCLVRIGHSRGDESHKVHCHRFTDVILLLGRDVPHKSKPRAKEKAVAKVARSPALPKKATIDGICVKSKEFLQTYEWRRLRMEALKEHGPVCQCCGASPATGAVMNVDHIKPRKLFPQLALELGNLQILCGPCNHGKGNWDMTDWRKDN